MTHPLHSIEFDDGTATAVTLEPPAWTDMSYNWEPVPRSSVFEAYDGTAAKQVNSGSTQKWRLTVTVTGCGHPGLAALSQSVTWTVTMIDRDATTTAQSYTMWPLTPPPQGIDCKGAVRTWNMEFRQE